MKTKKPLAEEAEDVFEGIITICLHPHGRALLTPKAQAALKWCDYKLAEIVVESRTLAKARKVFYPYKKGEVR